MAKRASGNQLDVSLNQTACDYVNGLNLGEGGCYDECWALAGKDAGPGYLDEKQPHELRNACAVVMYGGEY